MAKPRQAFAWSDFVLKKEVSQTYPYFVTYPALCSGGGVLLVNVAFIYYQQRVAETTPEGMSKGGDYYETGEKSCCPKKCPSAFEHQVSPLSLILAQNSPIFDEYQTQSA